MEKSAYISDASSCADKVRWLIGLLFIFASLMPWTHLSTNNLDSQPWPLLLAILFIFSQGLRLRIPLAYLLASMLLTIGVVTALFFTERPGSFLVFRAIANYSTIAAIFLASYVFYRNYGFPYRLIIATNLIWLIVAGMEIVSPDISSALSTLRTTPDRGVTSLAPEPTFFAIYLFFLSWLIIEQSRSVAFAFAKPLVIANVLSIFFLAQSAMVILYLVLALGSYGFYVVAQSSRFRDALGVAALILLLVVIFSTLLSTLASESRAVNLIAELKNQKSLMEIIAVDASVNQRLEAVVFSLYAAFDNVLVPHGFDQFIDKRNELISCCERVFWYRTESNKVMSWIGALVFELGLFGLLSFLVFCGLAYQSSLGSVIKLGFLTLLLLSAIPLAFPLIPMLVALMSSKKVHAEKNPHKCKMA